MKLRAEKKTGEKKENGSKKSKMPLLRKNHVSTSSENTHFE